MTTSTVRLLAASCTISALVACGPAPPAEPPGRVASETAAEPAPAGIDLSAFELVDLSYAYDDRTLFWPTATETFELHQVAYGMNDSGFFYAANTFCAPEHGGTHLDAPIHFGEGRHTVDQIPLGRLIAPAVVIDVAERAAADSDYLLDPSDVERFESAHGRIADGSIVLLRTGWGRHWGDALAYLGDDTPGDASNLHFPSFGEAAARLLIEERGTAMLGVDTASIDHGPSTDFLVHRLAAAHNVPGLENVAQLDRLPATGAWVIALPMKIGGGSGAPARIVALVPR